MYAYEDIRQVHLEVTTHCNASCPQCSRNIAGGPVNPNLPLSHLSLSDCKSIFPKEFIEQLKVVFLCGNYGDAMMAPEALEILEYFREHNKKLWLTLHTNGSGRTDPWWQRLARVATVCKFAIDGLEDTNHIYRRGTNWRKIMASVEAFIGAGGQAHWEYIVFKHNQHQVEDAYQLSKEMGFRKFNIKKTERFFSPGQSMEQLKTKVKDKVLAEQYTIHPTDDPRYIHEVYLNTQKEILSDGDFNHYLEQTSIDCAAVTDKRIYVSAEGLVFPCCYLSNIYRVKNTLSNQQVLYMIDAEPSGRASISGKQRGVSEILKSKLYQETIPAAWEKKKFSEGRLYTCARTCGSYKFCSASETKTN